VIGVTSICGCHKAGRRENPARSVQHYSANDAAAERQVVGSSGKIRGTGSRGKANWHSAKAIDKRGLKGVRVAPE